MHYPQTKLFLLAYLFFNDGIQTVIGNSSLYGIEELEFPQETVLGIFLFVQFVAFFGARFFGQVAARIGAWKTVLSSLGVWTGIVTVAFFVPGKSLVLFPAGKEAEYFSLYQAMERGTSWFGTLIFGLVYQATLSYRAAILALIVFFILGGVLLSRVKMREGIIQAGNEVPRVI